MHSDRLGEVKKAHSGPPGIDNETETDLRTSFGHLEQQPQERQAAAGVQVDLVGARGLLANRWRRHCTTRQCAQTSLSAQAGQPSKEAAAKKPPASATAKARASSANWRRAFALGKTLKGSLLVGLGGGAGLGREADTEVEANVRAESRVIRLECVCETSEVGPAKAPTSCDTATSKTYASVSSNQANSISLADQEQQQQDEPAAALQVSRPKRGCDLSAMAAKKTAKLQLAGCRPDAPTAASDGSELQSRQVASSSRDSNAPNRSSSSSVSSGSSNLAAQVGKCNAKIACNQALASEPSQLVPSKSQVMVELEPNHQKKRQQAGSSSGLHVAELAGANNGEPKREIWDKNIEFLLAVIGFAVDLGNVWRFPYICYMNGGGAFLIPYTILFIVGGLPIFYMEMSLGQFFSSGCLTVWRQVCPLAKGIGYAMCLLNFFTSLYYNTIISWAVFFFVESFTSELPWTSCNNSWNSDHCRTISERNAELISAKLHSELIGNGTGALLAATAESANFSSPTKEYFEREVLKMNLSGGIDNLGPIRQPLAIYLAIVFVCIYFAIWKGVKSTGKAVWITALLPYFVLLPLLLRGVFLEGAWLGIKYYLAPQWQRIFESNVWVEAAKQIYFSLGPGFGTLMALSSYNKFNHNCRRDALIAASVNYFASFIAGFVIFAVLGYMATIQNVGVPDVATDGPGLVFQVYPEGLATMRFSAVWSVLFFLMVITLGIDSTFGGLESVITGLCDEYPRLLRAHRGTFIGLLIVLIYFCSLPTATCGGQYVIFVLESYGTSLSLLFIVLIETIIVCWVYGTERFCQNIEQMSGSQPGLYWRICWKYISPSILVIIFLSACSQELGKYRRLEQGSYVYPAWAPVLGLIMTSSSVACIPIYALYHWQCKSGSGNWRERLRRAVTPIQDKRAQVHEAKLADQSQLRGSCSDANAETIPI